MSRVGQAATVAGRLPRTPGPSACRKRRPTPAPAREFVGCDAVPMTLAEYESYPEDGRKIEFFDSAAGLAWMARDAATVPHELPARLLNALVVQIAQVRGSPIRCYGGSQLRLLDPETGRVRALHADEMVFLHPERVRRRQPGCFTVGEDAWPDVVLEVDHTTDVRREKLREYEEGGFPELWVEVPNAYAAWRPAGLRPGLRIYLLEGGNYRLSEESRAFPTWRAEEIHRALNEETPSAATLRDVNRVGEALGEREGTGPDDDPLLGPQRARARAESRAATARAILGSRRIPVSPEFPPAGIRAALEAVSEATVVAAALAAVSEADLLVRLGDTPAATPGNR